MEIKKNASLIAAIAIPILMILAISASVYLPAMFVHPQYDFIYTDGDRYGSLYRYEVNGNFLVKKDNACGAGYSSEYCSSRTDSVRIYYYDVAKGESREIYFSEAAQIKLDPMSKSPDGFEIASAGGGGPFFSGDYNAKFLKKGAYSKKINRLSANRYDFEFLGWVKK